MAKVRKFSSGGDVPDFSRLTFKEAFQAARGGPNAKTAMNKEFTWNGKKYSTGLSEDKKASAPKRAEGQKFPLRSEEESSEDKYKRVSSSSESKAARAKVEESDKPLEESHPEAILPVGKAIRMLGGAAAAARGSKQAPQVKREPYFEKNKPARNVEEERFADEGNPNFKRGGKVKKMASGGATKSASSRGDGIAQRGKTKGRMY